MPRRLQFLQAQNAALAGFFAKFFYRPLEGKDFAASALD
jgi:hypothetical protein